MLHIIAVRPGRSRSIMVVDMDGTIVDNSERARVAQELAGCQRCSEFFRQLLRADLAEKLDKPIHEVASAVGELAAMYGADIAVVTGRPAFPDLVDVTLRQAEEALKTTPVLIVMRQSGDYRKDYDYKTEAAEWLARRYDILLWVDDSEKVVEALKKLGINAMTPQELLSRTVLYA